MKHALSLRQAKRLVRTFSRIKGLRVYVGETLTAYTITDLIVIPFDSQSRARALAKYRKTRNAAEALATYDGKKFDVILVTDDPHYRIETYAIELCAYMKERGVPIDIRYYTSLLHRFFR